MNSVYKYNDPWLSEVKKVYQRIQKAASSFLRKQQSSEGTNSEEKHDLCAAEDVKNLIRKIKLEIQQVETTLNDTFSNLSEAKEIHLSQVHVYNDLKLELMNAIDTRIPGLLRTLAQTAGPNEKDEVDKLNNMFVKFESKQKPRLYDLVHIMAQKISQNLPSGPTRSTDNTEVVHLKKIDPPSFSGKEEDFPEFHRKWLAIVGLAKLPAEAEIDRLREALPVDARDMLTGITTVTKAWDILKKRYGVIVNILFSQSKRREEGS